MGMSATQARYLSLVAQQSNLEYQGQQINQERSVLSQQVSDLYNTLLAMQVPTPPSTQEYTTVQYTGKLGATSYFFDASSVKPGTSPNTYTVVVSENAYGHSASKDNTVATVNGGEQAPLMRATVPTDFPRTSISDVWIPDESGVGVRLARPEDFDTSVPGQYDQLTGVTYFIEDSTGTEQFDTARTVSGHQLYTLASALAAGIINQSQYDGYVTAINNSGIVNAQGQPYGPDKFYLFFDDDKNAKFALIEDVDDGNNNATTYSYVPNGNYTKNRTYNECDLTFDPSTGRILTLRIPEVVNGQTIYTEISLSAKTVTDTVAYDNAMAQYEYEQYKYDKEQQEINARTEIIQQQDRNLELKLQRLDTQRTQITTEMEALEKVLDENIEQSYKVFSG